jgi:serine/threonine protein kinase
MFSFSEDEQSHEEYESDTLVAYNIIYPGLVLKSGEYILLKKIGYGKNATVWMTYNTLKDNYSAMKIQDDECFEDGCREINIIKRINNFAAKNTNVNTYCVTMIDVFYFEEDENTKYVCSVYDLYAGSVQILINEGKYKYGLPINSVRQIVKQILSALTVMHDTLNIIHTDIKPENVLFRGASEYQKVVIELFEESGFKEKYAKILENNNVGEYNEKIRSEIEILAVTCVSKINDMNEIICGYEFVPDDETSEEEFMDSDDENLFDCQTGESSNEYSDDSYDYYTPGKINVRNQSVDDMVESLDYFYSHDMDNYSNEIDGCLYDFTSVLNKRDNSNSKYEIINDAFVKKCDITVTDFGNSYFYNKRVSNEIQDRRYRAPEIIMDFKYGYAVDMWSLGCVVFELLTGYVLFEPLDEPLNRDIHHLYLIEKMIGPIPVNMKRATKRSKFLFDKSKNYHIKNIDKFVPCPLKERLVKQFLFSQNDADEIISFILCLLQINPSKRSTARQMLLHPWLIEQ